MFILQHHHAMLNLETADSHG